jgi:hypothetical protein
LACGPLLAEVDVDRPMLGLQHLRLLGERINGCLMGVGLRDEATPNETPWQVFDVYTRGNDLVASYREPAGQPFHLQIYWRVLQSKKLMNGLLEAIVSIQTRLWEAYPRIVLHSMLSAAQARLDEGGVNFLSHHDWSYVEASPPGDFQPALDEPTPGMSRACWRYGDRFMERGVIRRLRVRGAFTPIASAEDAIKQIRADLASEPPPLTA